MSTFDPRTWHEFFSAEVADAQRALATIATGVHDEARARRSGLQQHARRHVADRVRDHASSRERLEQALRDVAASASGGPGVDGLPDGAARHVRDYALLYLRKLQGNPTA